MDIAKDRYNTHIISAINPEFTICGNAFEGDAMGLEYDRLAWKRVKGNYINCNNCCKEAQKIIKENYILKKG